MTQASARAATENLLVAIDLGEAPTLDIVAEQANVLVQLYNECYTAELVFTLSATSPGVGLGQSFVPNLFVRRMSLASPWEIVLAQAATVGPYATSAVVGGFGALRIFKTLLELKMQWDKHRLEMARGQVDLERLQMDHAAETVRQFRETLAVETGTPAEMVETREELVDNVRRLNPLTRVESIPDDDPRA